MSQETLRKCMELSTDLSTAERKQLQTYLKSLLANSKGASDKTEEPEEKYLADIVNRVMQEQGMGLLPIERLKAASTGYAQESAKLWAFAQRALPDGTRTEHLAVLRLGVKLLTHNIAAQGIPVTHAVVMRQLHRLPAVVQAAFPGYAQLGVLGIVVREVERGKRHNSSTGRD